MASGGGNPPQKPGSIEALAAGLKALQVQGTRPTLEDPLKDQEGDVPVEDVKPEVRDGVKGRTCIFWVPIKRGPHKNLRLTKMDTRVSIFIPDTENYQPFEIPGSSFRGQISVKKDGKIVEWRPVQVTTSCHFYYWPPTMRGQYLPTEHLQTAIKRASDPKARVQWLREQNGHDLVFQAIPHYSSVRADPPVDLSPMPARLSGKKVQKPRYEYHWHAPAGRERLPEKTLRTVVDPSGNQIQQWGWAFTPIINPYNEMLPGPTEVPTKPGKFFDSQQITVYSEAAPNSVWVPHGSPYKYFQITPQNIYADVICQDGTKERLSFTTHDQQHVFWPPRTPGQNVPPQYARVSNPKLTPFTNRCVHATVATDFDPPDINYYGIKPASEGVRGQRELVHFPRCVMPLPAGSIVINGVQRSYPTQTCVTSRPGPPLEVEIRWTPEYTGPLPLPLPDSMRYHAVQLVPIHGQPKSQDLYLPLSPESRAMMQFLYYPLPQPEQNVPENVRKIVDPKNHLRTYLCLKGNNMPVGQSFWRDMYNVSTKEEKDAHKKSKKSHISRTGFSEYLRYATTKQHLKSADPARESTARSSASEAETSSSSEEEAAKGAVGGSPISPRARQRKTRSQRDAATGKVSRKSPPTSPQKVGRFQVSKAPDPRESSSTSSSGGMTQKEKAAMKSDYEEQSDYDDPWQKKK